MMKISEEVIRLGDFIRNTFEAQSKSLQFSFQFHFLDPVVKGYRNVRKLMNFKFFLVQII